MSSPAGGRCEESVGALKDTRATSLVVPKNEARSKSADSKKRSCNFLPLQSSSKIRPKSETRQVGGGRISSERNPQSSTAERLAATSPHKTIPSAANSKKILPESPRGKHEKPRTTKPSSHPNGLRSPKRPSADALDAPITPQNQRRASKFGLKVAQVLSQVDFQACDPSTCVSVMKVPSLKNYSALLRQLKNCQKSWLEGFLEERGLEILLEGLEVVCRRKVQLTDAMMLLECVACIKAIMNCQQGLELFTVNKDYSKSLIKALDSTNVAVKKQVFDLTSALCVSSEEGFRTCLEAVESFKVHMKQRHRFFFLVNELRNQTSLDFNSSVLSLINCLVNSNEEAQRRIEIRNEFIGLNILEVIENLRSADHEDLEVQCEVFLDSKQADDDLISNSLGVQDGSDHKTLFAIIYDNVYNKPEEVILLNILQKLMRIDTTDENGLLVWDVIDKFISKVLISDNSMDILLQLSSGIVQKKSKEIQTDTPNANITKANLAPQKSDPGGRLNFKKVLELTLSGHKKELNSEKTAKNVRPTLNSTNQEEESSVPPPPPPLPPPPPNPPGVTILPPPPPPPLDFTHPKVIFQNLTGSPPPPPPPPGSNQCPPGPPAPPSIPGFINPPPICPSIHTPTFSPLVQQTVNISSSLAIPTPKVKIKNFNWSKVPAQEATKKDKIWSSVLDPEDPVTVNYDKVEELFSRKVAAVQATPQNKTKQTRVINLMDMRKSMAVDIWLRQFRCPSDDVVDSVRRADTTRFDIGQAREFIKILPESSEIEQIKNFEGDRNTLGSAEKFIGQLVQVPDYLLRLELITFKLEFPSTFESSSRKQEAFLETCRNIVDSSSFKHFLRIVLQIGNFLNVGSYAGNAAGFKISSLTKLRDTQSNQRGVTLLHHVVSVAPQVFPDSLDFVVEFYDCVQASSKLTIENINSDLNKLSTSLKNLSKRLEKCEDSDLKENFKEFFLDSEKKVEELTNRQQDIERDSEKLCRYLCEDQKSFKLEECSATIYTFIEQVKTSIKENEQRKLQEEKMERRKKEREASKMKNTKSKEASTESSKEECVIDRLLEDIRKGTTLRHRRKPVCQVEPMGKHLQLEKQSDAGGGSAGNDDDLKGSEDKVDNGIKNVDGGIGPLQMDQINFIQSQIEHHFLQK